MVKPSFNVEMIYQLHDALPTVSLYEDVITTIFQKKTHEMSMVIVSPINLHPRFLFLNIGLIQQILWITI